jgi:hypothetical protein
VAGPLGRGDETSHLSTTVLRQVCFFLQSTESARSKFTNAAPRFFRNVSVATVRRSFFSSPNRG